MNICAQLNQVINDLVCWFLILNIPLTSKYDPKSITSVEVNLIATLLSNSSNLSGGSRIQWLKCRKLVVHCDDGLLVPWLNSFGVLCNWFLFVSDFWILIISWYHFFYLWWAVLNWSEISVFA
ncbi:hypothetical protein E2542_SST09390 [Spatholobus suberectus]|nr:hypothetical protein E2542_SST09390 [Spatholobus suberectus]